MKDEQEFNQLFYRPPNFCLDCGDLLDFEIINNNSVKCQKCGGETKLDNIKNHYIETYDKYESSKIWMNKLKNKEDKLREEQKNERNIIDEKCPKCGNGQMYYYSMQTRSVDEGSTIFYECVKCHYKYNQNN
jgi:DNA-directed RNA polymerase I subunit RPA12